MTADKELAAALDALGFGEADAERRAAQTEAAQLSRWGRSGLDILGVPTSYLPPDEGEQGCEACGGPLPSSGPGRPRRFCGPACRQRAHRAGKGRATAGVGKGGAHKHQRAFRDRGEAA
jgi:hypothetical protein